MALPESFQIALKRAEDERRIEREDVLSRIGDTVQRGVPYLSGVVAGALSRSPIVGIGTAFIADALKDRFERKQQEKAARRMEMRQRDAAAEIAVREGLFQDKKTALQAIEESRLQQEQENTKKREQALLDQFNLQRQEEEVQEKQEAVVREQSEGPEGLALQSTLAHVDSEISGIADLLLDRFAEEEERFEKAEDRRELEAAKLRESLSEASRMQTEQVREVTGEDGAPERDRRGVTGTLFRIFGRIPLPIILAGLGIAIVTGIGLAIKDMLPSTEEIKKKVVGVDVAGTPEEKKQYEEEQDAVGDPLGLSTTAEEDANLVRQRAVQNDATITAGEFDNVQRDVTQAPEGTGPSWVRILAGLFSPLIESIDNLVTSISASFAQQRLEQVESRIQFLTQSGTPAGTPQYQQEVDEMSQLMQERDDLLRKIGEATTQETSALVPSSPQLGGTVAKVSFDQSGSAPVVAPVIADASTKSTTTNINNSRTINAIGSTARNDEGRSKFTYA